MLNFKEDDLLGASEEQTDALRRLGVPELELEGLSFADAEEWLAELEAMRDQTYKGMQRTR